MKKMLIRLFTPALVALMLPVFVFAAYDDVTLTTDVIINVGGVDLTVSGSSAVVESIVVNSSNFTFTLLENSLIKVTSADRRILTTDAANKFITTRTCDSSASVIEHASYGPSPVITVTPESTTCTNDAGLNSSGSRSGGGGGGGGSSTAIRAVTTPDVATNVTATQTTTVTQSTTKVVLTFTRAIAPGATNSDVKQLQKFLNANGFTIATTGAGSPGNETDFYGKLTREAVQKFQAQYGIVSSGTPSTTGYGRLGPKTLAKMKELSK